jgi:hypothetical protein
MFVLRSFQTDSTPLPCDRWQFTQLPIRIGRNPQNDFAPQHPAISNFHACIERCGDRICIRDLGSSNGVLLAVPATGELVRIQPNTSVDLAPTGYRFFLSASVWVQLEIVDSVGIQAQPGVRSSAVPAPAPVPAVQQQGGQAFSTAPAAVQERRAPQVPVQPAAVPYVPEGGPQSQYLRVELDYLALQGLRELAHSLVPGRNLDTTGDVARLITKLHDIVDVFCRSFVPLRQGYEQFVSSLELEAHRSKHMSPAAVKLEIARSPEEVAQALLDPRETSAEACRAAESVLADLARHQIALLDGVMQGVRALLDELSPAKIEATLDQSGAHDLFASKYRERWTEYCQRYERFSDQREAFGVIFGQDFADVYRRYWNREHSRPRR